MESPAVQPWEELALPFDEGAVYASPREALPRPPAEKGKDAGFSSTRQGVDVFLCIESGPCPGTLYPLSFGTLLIGRGSQSTLRLEQLSVSRSHAEILRQGNRFFIRDLGSQNGTRVNRLRIDGETELFLGDQIEVGAAKLRLQAAPRRSPTRPSSQRGKSSSPKSTLVIAAAASGIGFGLAMLAMVAWLKLSRGPSYEDLDPDLSHRTARGETGTDSTDVRLSRLMAPPAAPVDSEPAQSLLQPIGPAQHTETNRKPSGKPLKTKKRALAAHGSGSELERSAILAPFMEGDAGAALRNARDRGQQALVARLTRFVWAYDAGERALSAQNETSALQQLHIALTLDQELSSGQSAYTPRLRQQLSALYTLQGRKKLGEDKAAARSLFETALGYDPENALAKLALSRLPREQTGRTRLRSPGGLTNERPAHGL